MAFVKIPWGAPQRGRQMCFRAAEIQAQGASWTPIGNHIPSTMWGRMWKFQSCQMGTPFLRSRGRCSVCRWPGIQLLLTTLWVASPIIFLTITASQPHPALMLYPSQAPQSVIVMPLSPVNPLPNPPLSSILARLTPSTLSTPSSGHQSSQEHNIPYHRRLCSHSL